MINLAEKTILLTGAYGFLGRHLRKALKGNVIAPQRKNYDFRRQDVCEYIFNKYKIDIVINLAANVGGIGYNQTHPAELFYDNAIMGINLIHKAYKTRVEKFIQLGTICAYPKFTPIPFEEKNLWLGYPEDTNAPYGLAKKMLLVQCQAYRKQYGFNAIYLLPVNLYGPGDNFNPQSSHVIPAMIRKFVGAKEERRKEVEIWGTGTPTREFLYVEDCAKAIVLAAKKYDKGDPVNLGSGQEISIKHLALLIKYLVGYKGKIVLNPNKPDGQPRRSLDITKAYQEFGFKAQTKFEDGLKKTINWYLENRAAIKHYENFSNNSKL